MSTFKFQVLQGLGVRDKGLAKLTSLSSGATLDQFEIEPDGKVKMDKKDGK